MPKLKSLCSAALLLAQTFLSTQCANAAIDQSFQDSDVNLPAHKFRDGSFLPSVRIHYSTLGTPVKSASGEITNAVLLLHWTGTSGEVFKSPEFQETLFAPGCPLDASKYFLIMPDNIGHGQSSKPSLGLKTQFPHYGYMDMVDLQHQLVTDSLHIHKLRAIIGLSMGGMHAWLWTELYPESVDAVMPIVSQPARVTGRNLLWRRIVASSIRNDPDWKNGMYEQPPHLWAEGALISRILIDGVPHLETLATDRASADKFVEQATAEMQKREPNDFLYAIESSLDYDPEPKLSDIKAKVYVVNFADDEFYAAELQVLPRLMPKVKQGKFVILPASDLTSGHMTMAHPRAWASEVTNFLNYTNN